MQQHSEKILQDPNNIQTVPQNPAIRRTPQDVTSVVESSKWKESKYIKKIDLR